MTNTDMDRLREIGRLRAENERMARRLKEVAEVVLGFAMEQSAADARKEGRHDQD